MERCLTNAMRCTATIHELERVVLQVFCPFDCVGHVLSANTFFHHWTAHMALLRGDTDEAVAQTRLV